MKNKDKKRVAERLSEGKNSANKKTKALTVGLGVGLTLVAAAAIVSPIIIAMQKGGGGDTPTPTPTNIHTVTFMNGSEVYQTSTVKDGAKVYAPKDPSKNNYIFKEWVKEGETVGYDFNRPVTSDFKLIATFEPVIVVTHTITFFSGEGGTFVEGGTKKEGKCNDNAYFISISKPAVQNKDGYTLIGWTDADGNDLSAVQITKDINAYAKYTKAEKYVSLYLSDLNTKAVESSYDIKIRGQEDYSWKQTEGKQYKDIKNSLPIAVCTDKTAQDTFTFSNWSLDPQTDFANPNPEPTDTYPIGGEEGQSILYPQFTVDKKAVTVELKVNLVGDQQLKSGETTIKVPYEEGSEKLFKNINKPEVFDGNKLFIGYYHDAAFENEWDPETKITPSLENKDIYIKMEAPITQPEITFTVDDEAELSKYKWVGNHEHIKCDANTPLANISVPNVYYKDAKENPNPAIGFTSSYYFTNWFYKKDGKEVPVDSGFKITNSITLYAKFARKTQVTIEVEEVEEGKTPKTVVIEALPTTKWVDIVKPEITTLSKTTRFLTGWKATSTEAEGSETKIFTSDTKIGDIPLLDSEAAEKKTVHVVPIISDKVNTITFDKTPYAETGSATEVWYQGCTTVGVDMYKNINVLKEVNKPAMPLYDEETETLKNQDFSFNDKWQIKGGQWNDYTTVDEDTVIPAVPEGQDPVSYSMRPIVNGNVTITYDAGSSGKLEEGAIASVSVGTSKPFSEIYKPTVVTTEENKTFSHWATKTGTTYMEVSPTDKFDQNTTLYAVYTTNKVQSSVNFQVAKSDLEDTAFPAQPINDDNCFTTAITHNPSDPAYFKDFGYKTPTKKQHHFKAWGTYNTKGELVELPGSTIVEPGTALNVFAIFEPNATSYHKVSITNGSGVYIEGPTTFYIGDGDTLPINSLSYDIVTDDATITAWTVGKNLSGWSSGGKPVTNKTIVTEDMEITPTFTAPEQQPIVKFEIVMPGQTEPTGSIISDRTPRTIDVNDLLKPKIDLGVWAPTVSKPKSDFVKWQILDKDGITLTDITETTRVRNNMLTNNTLTLVASFMDESIYEGIDGAYFYDSKKEKWGTIQSYFYEGDTNCLKVQYQDGQVEKVSKSTFDYEIKFGKQTKTIPDYFMFGCSDWNNGGQPLKFPSNIQSIGKDVMFGCSSFDQPITSTIELDSLPQDPTQTDKPIFVIGENFMKNCYRFDSSISLNYTGSLEKPNLVISEGFMSECQKLGKTITSVVDFSGWADIGLRDTYTGLIRYSDDLQTSDFYSCLSTIMQDPYTINIKVKDQYVKSGFEKAFKSVDDISLTPYHRKTNIYY